MYEAVAYYDIDDSNVGGSIKIESFGPRYGTAMNAIHFIYVSNVRSRDSDHVFSVFWDQKHRYSPSYLGRLDGDPGVFVSALMKRVGVGAQRGDGFVTRAYADSELAQLHKDLTASAQEVCQAVNPSFKLPSSCKSCIDYLGKNFCADCGCRIVEIEQTQQELIGLICDYLADELDEDIHEDHSQECSCIKRAMMDLAEVTSSNKLARLRIIRQSKFIADHLDKYSQSTGCVIEIAESAKFDRLYKRLTEPIFVLHRADRVIAVPANDLGVEFTQEELLAMAIDADKYPLIMCFNRFMYIFSGRLIL